MRAFFALCCIFEEFMLVHTVCIRDLDKINLIWQFGLGQFPLLPQKIVLASKAAKSDPRKFIPLYLPRLSLNHWYTRWMSMENSISGSKTQHNPENACINRMWQLGLNEKKKIRDCFTTFLNVVIRWFLKLFRLYLSFHSSHFVLFKKNYFHYITRFFTLQTLIKLTTFKWVQINWRDFLLWGHKCFSSEVN